jgi:hypothetical protein
VHDGHGRLRQWQARWHVALPALPSVESRRDEIGRKRGGQGTCLAGRQRTRRTREVSSVAAWTFGLIEARQPNIVVCQSPRRLDSYHRWRGGSKAADVAGHQRGSMMEGGACREWCMGHRGWKMIVGPDAVEVR